MEDQRDYAEEAANRAHLEQEGREELAAERTMEAIMRAWRHADAHAQVALINACDWYVRSLGVEDDNAGEIIMTIMVQALHGVSAEKAYVIVEAEILAARRRKG